jgi:membrane fusion protein, copper/silver efflux system
MNLRSSLSRLPQWIWGVGALALIVGFLVVQDARNGWPFSRHHAMQFASSGQSKPVQSASKAAASASRVPVSLDSKQFGRLGVRFEPARLESVTSDARHTAVVTTDESRISHVHTRVSGWVEKLHINTTGQSVRVGQPLAEVFSQELFASQNEYLAAFGRSGDAPGSAVLEAARTRLSVLGMSAADIEALKSTGEARRLVKVVAPRSGIVLRRGVTVGTAVDPSTELVTIADLSQVWVLAEVPESESTRLKIGGSAMLTFPSSGRPPFPAKIDFVYPTLSERTRTVRVRFVVRNPDDALRPGLYGTAAFGAPAREALTIARDAVVDTGNTQHVFVRSSEGVLEPRTVRLGTRLADRLEVIEGLEAGEQVAAAGVFLIDSESRLRASGAGGHFGHGGKAAGKGADVKAEAAPAVEHSGH